MALKKVVKKDTQKNPENVQKGKRSKRKGGNYERLLAKLFGEKYGVELKRTPQSGGFAKKSTRADDYRGDITIVDPNNMLKVHIEAKNQKTWQLKSWIEQSESDCPEGRIPIVVFHQHNTGNNYVCMSLDSFFELVPKSKVVGRR